MPDPIISRLRRDPRALLQAAGEARHIVMWLELGRDTVLPVILLEETLRRTEQRSAARAKDPLAGVNLLP